jgi:hypothetical protein
MLRYILRMFCLLEVTGTRNNAVNIAVNMYIYIYIFRCSIILWYEYIKYILRLYLFISFKVYNFGLLEVMGRPNNAINICVYVVSYYSNI